MNKSALALAGFGFAAGIVLIIVVEPLLSPGPKKEPLAPQLAAMVVAKPTTVLPNTGPAADDPAIQAAKITVAKGLKDPPSAAIAEPANLRCTNVSVSNPNPNAYYAFVTVDLDAKKIKMVTNYPGGSSAFDYDITQADDQKISALSFDQGLERRLVLDRLSGRIAGKINGRYGWVTSDFDCQPAAKRVL